MSIDGKTVKLLVDYTERQKRISPGFQSKINILSCFSVYLRSRQLLSPYSTQLIHRDLINININQFL